MVIRNWSDWIYLFYSKYLLSQAFDLVVALHREQQSYGKLGTFHAVLTTGLCSSRDIYAINRKYKRNKSIHNSLSSHSNCRSIYRARQLSHRFHLFKIIPTHWTLQFLIDLFVANLDTWNILNFFLGKWRWARIFHLI